jgi:hypothetical protein
VPTYAVSAGKVISPDKSMSDEESNATRYPEHPERALASADTSQRSRRAECRDDYPAILLSGTMRVINCRNGVQWALQRRRSHLAHSWRGFGYFRTKAALLRQVRKFDETAVSALAELPERHGGRERTAKAKPES